MFEKVNVYDLQLNPFQEIGKNWTLISAAVDGKVNTMTASWGNMGVLWGKEALTVYIRQSRYTKEFVDAQEYFTVSLFDEDKKKPLGLLGKKSGRDGDKIAEAGFHVTMVEGQPAFEESKMVFVCRKMYQADMPKAAMPEEAIKAYYPDDDIHTMYIGEIVACYVNK
ncbi:MAG: flavin reductase [Lachnospiraceae bacterium]|nr:flavin reductase [Lachnospiraceae bacterium]